MDEERFSRQILQLGEEGQNKISNSKIAIVGVGALGTVAADLLARTGVGELLLIDRDVIELSNLQRQSLFNEEDLGKGKAETAKDKLKKINSQLNIKSESIHLNQENISLLKEYSLILDCTDNLQTRFLLNDFCKKNKIKWIYAAAIQKKGYVFPIFPEGPCLKCFLQEANLDTCDTIGVLNTITYSIAALQVNLTLKILLNELNNSYLYYYDIWQPELKKLVINKNPNCQTCQENYLYLNKKEIIREIRFCSTGKFQIRGKKLDFTRIKEKLEKIGEVKEEEDLLKFKEITLFRDGRALIKADSKEKAISIYDKYVGN